jgi:hypothetical protein
MLIKRVHAIAPFACPGCGSQMTVVAVIEPSPGDVIEKILRGHRRAAMVGGLWQASVPRVPPDVGRVVESPSCEACGRCRQPSATVPGKGVRKGVGSRRFFDRLFWNGAHRADDRFLPSAQTASGWSPVAAAWHDDGTEYLKTESKTASMIDPPILLG